MTLPIHCPLCQSDHNHINPVTPHVFGSESHGRAFYSCDNCEVIFQHPNLTDNELAKFYSDEFESFMNIRSGTSNIWSSAHNHSTTNSHHYERRLPFFQHLFNSNSCILEYGCSSGFMLYPLMQQGCEVHGVEPSGLFSKYSSTNGIHIHDHNHPPLDNYENYFDLILHFFVFEHILDPFDFLSKQFNLLKPGGSILFEVPSSSDALYRLYDIPEFERFYFSVAHPWYYNYSSLSYVLDKLKFNYKLIPHQRYDFSNHFVWALKRSPGGMNKYSRFFSDDFDSSYKRELIASGFPDTYFVEIYKS